MTDQELAQTYVALLPIQWSGPNAPNAQATIDLLATVGIAQQIVGQVLSGFALTNIYGQTPAQGKQLDILGQFVGARRQMVMPPVLPFFQFDDTRAPFAANGFGDTRSGTPPTDYFDDTRLVPTITTLTDAQMISLIQWLAILNHMETTIANIDALLFKFFGTWVTAAEGAMSITYNSSGGNPNEFFYQVLKYFNAFPHPAGVEIIVNG